MWRAYGLNLASFFPRRRFMRVTSLRGRVGEERCRGGKLGVDKTWKARYCRESIKSESGKPRLRQPSAERHGGTSSQTDAAQGVQNEKPQRVADSMGRRHR